MKTFLCKILLFFIIVTFVDISVGAFGSYLQGHAKGGSTRQFDDLVMNDKHDVLILGSSRAHHHYDTPFLSDTLGLDVYNAGFDGNGIVLAYGVMEMVLNKYAPKLVLFDIEPAFDVVVYAKDNNHIRYIKNLKPYYKEHGVSELLMDVSKEEWYKVHSGLIRNNTEILGSMVDNIIDRGVEVGGYAPLIGKMDREPKMHSSEEAKIDTFKLGYIKKLISLCMSHDISLVLVGSPKYGEKNSNDLEPVKRIAEEYSVPFWDYYSDPSFQEHKEWFNEPMHLNQEGAIFFSRIIADRISGIL